MKPQTIRTNGFFTVLINFLVLLYHSIARDVRKANGNALVAIVLEILQTVVMVVIFYVFITILGKGGALIRGSFLMFIMSGVFLFMTHTKTMGKVTLAATATNPMRTHAPVSALLLILTAAFSTLYIQVLAMGVLLLIVNVFIEPVLIANPKLFALCFFLSWFSGLAFGVLFMGASAFFPKIVGVISMVFQRANMIFSGKMLAAKNLTPQLLPFFVWNPLFHLVDQARNAAFLNYNSEVTNLQYPIYFSIIILLLGLMIENYARKTVSISANARR